jgi:hypothetical protein
MYSSVLPRHKATRKTNYNSIEIIARKLEPLVGHFDYLKNLGEVQGTRIISTLFNGMINHDNRDDTFHVMYLPISMGYLWCY